MELENEINTQLQIYKNTLTTKIEDTLDYVSSNQTYDYRTLNLTLIRCLELLNQIEALEQRKFALEFIDDLFDP